MSTFDLGIYRHFCVEIYGQEHIKRVLEVVAADGHNMLMSGPPGAGKTLTSRSILGILARMTMEEALDVPHIYSVATNFPLMSR